MSCFQAIYFRKDKHNPISVCIPIYGSHFPVYKESGIGKLGGNDLLRMVFVPKLKDTFGSPEGRSLIKKLFPVLFSERLMNPDFWDSAKNPGLKRPGEF